MNKDEFSALLRKDVYSEQDMDRIEGLLEKYPWFSIPGFLKLKAAYQLRKTIEEEELAKLTVFSNDRKYLYLWIRDEVQPADMAPTLKKSEIEFISDSSADEEEINAFELLDDEDGTEVDEAEAKAIPEKDEVDMEEPEIEEPAPLPVIDTIDDEEDEEEFAETPEKKEILDINGPEIPDTPVPEDDDSLRKDSTQEEKSPEKRELIEQFLKSDPGVIKADKESNLTGDISADSVKEDDRFITDTLAKIYVKQGLHAKAIYAYERLSLKYPEKSAYFAAQIEKIKSVSNL